MQVHARVDADHTAGVDDAFVDWFTLAGPVARVLPRFVELARLGLDFVHVIPASTGVLRAVAVTSLAGLGQGLPPALRSAHAAAARSGCCGADDRDVAGPRCSGHARLIITAATSIHRPKTRQKLLDAHLAFAYSSPMLGVAFRHHLPTEAPAHARPILRPASSAPEVDIVPPEILTRPSHDEVRSIDRPERALLLDSSLRRLARTEACCRRVLGRLAARFLQRKSHESLSFVRVADYARERLGISARELQEIATVSKALDQLPALAAAFEAGELSWTHVRLLGKVATPSTEAHWIGLARGRTVRAFDALLREDAAAASVTVDPSSSAITSSSLADVLAEDDDTVDGEPAARFHLLCPRRLRGRWRALVELARRVAGAPLSVWRAAEAIAAEGLSGAPGLPSAPRDGRGDDRDGSPMTGASPVADATWDPRTAMLRFFALGDRFAMQRDSGDASPVDSDEAHAGVPGLDWEALEAMTPEHVATLGEGLEACDAAELDCRLCVVLSTMRRLDWQTGRLLRLFADLRLPLLMGFDSLGHYVRERLGISAAKARALIALERATWRAPALLEEYSAGRLSWARVWTVLPVVVGRAGAAWVRRASEVTVRRLADEVDWALTLQDVTPLWSPVEPPPPGAALELPAEQMRAHCEQRGIDAEVTFRGPRSVVMILREAIAAFAEADDLPWQACERLFDHVEAEWRSQPRHPDPVFARDGWRCAVPACSGRSNLHDHHIVFRSHGGTNARSNRVTVCAAHHIHGIHGQRTRAMGKAPDAIHWDLGLRAHGPPLMRLIGDRYVSA